MLMGIGKSSPLDTANTADIAAAAALAATRISAGMNNNNYQSQQRAQQQQQQQQRRPPGGPALHPNRAALQQQGASSQQPSFLSSLPPPGTPANGQNTTDEGLATNNNNNAAGQGQIPLQQQQQQQQQQAQQQQQPNFSGLFGNGQAGAFGPFAGMGLSGAGVGGAPIMMVGGMTTNNAGGMGGMGGMGGGSQDVWSQLQMAQMSMQQQMQQQMVATVERAANEENQRIEAEYKKTVAELEHRLHLATSQFQNIQAVLTSELDKAKDLKQQHLDQVQKKLSGFLPPGARLQNQSPPTANNQAPTAPTAPLAVNNTADAFQQLMQMANFAPSLAASAPPQQQLQQQQQMPSPSAPLASLPALAGLSAPQQQQPTVQAAALGKVPKYKRSVVFEGWCQQALGLDPATVVATSIKVLCQHLAQQGKPLPPHLSQALTDEFVFQHQESLAWLQDMFDPDAGSAEGEEEDDAEYEEEYEQEQQHAPHQHTQHAQHHSDPRRAEVASAPAWPQPQQHGLSGPGGGSGGGGGVVRSHQARLYMSTSEYPSYVDPASNPSGGYHSQPGQPKPHELAAPAPNNYPQSAQPSQTPYTDHQQHQQQQQQQASAPQPQHQPSQPQPQQSHSHSHSRSHGGGSRRRSYGRAY